MNAKAHDKLVLRADLDVVPLELPVSHVVFFHPHEGSVLVCLGVALAAAKLLLLLLVPLVTGQVILFKRLHRLFESLVLRLVG